MVAGDDAVVEDGDDAIVEGVDSVDSWVRSGLDLGVEGMWETTTDFELFRSRLAILLFPSSCWTTTGDKGDE